MVSSWLSGRILDWHFSQPGFDPSFGNLACLATLKICDTMKLSVDDKYSVCVCVCVALPST